MENKNYIWRPVSEYTGGRVLATNGLDVIIGEINSEGDCKSEEDGSTILCGITGFIKIEEMLPELKESERIRKAIIKHFEKERKESRKVNYYGVDVFDILAWLEKQGEQKGLDYPYVTGWRKNYKDNKPKVKHSVLMFTTHGIAEGEWLGEEWCQYRWSCKIKDEDVLYWLHLSDLENLEKENVEQEPAWSEEDENMIEDTIQFIEKGWTDNGKSHLIPWLKSLKGKLQPKPKQEWSKLDNRIEDCIGMCLTDISEKRFDDFKTSLKECLDWLHSLKDRMWYQPSQEWSEEDKEKLNRIYMLLPQCIDCHPRIIGDRECVELQDWLKSLKDRYTWKPSDAQMTSITCAVRKMKESACYDSELVSLLNDLKKLK